ncbi:MAG: hypothetical protein GY703_11505 [Gammaproteobacteria bacterium]|nr:hypothetical protein [Gammaproteobacteria bacterium]
MSKRSRTPRAKVKVDTYRDDRLYPRVAQAVGELLAKGNVVAPVDVLVYMELLKPKYLEDWRRGRVPYLEKVIDCNLNCLSKLLRILRFYAHDMKLVPSATAYMRWGKGPKQRVLFTKTGDPQLEEAYARHFVWPGKGLFHFPAASNEKPRDTGSDREVQNSLSKE